MAITPLNKLTDMLGFTNVRGNQPIPPSKSFIDENVPEKKKVVLEWTTVTRPEISTSGKPKINRSYLIIGFFVAVLLVLMQEFLLIAAVGSLVFLWFVLSAAPIQTVTHQITTHGVVFADQFYGWKELKNFFFTKTENMNTLNINTDSRLPGRLILMINAEDMSTAQDALGKYLEFMETPPNFAVNKLFDSVIDRIKPTE